MGLATCGDQPWMGLVMLPWVKTKRLGKCCGSPRYFAAARTIDASAWLRGRLMAEEESLQEEVFGCRQGGGKKASSGGFRNSRGQPLPVLWEGCLIAEELLTPE